MASCLLAALMLPGPEALAQGPVPASSPGPVEGTVAAEESDQRLSDAIVVVSWLEELSTHFPQPLATAEARVSATGEFSIPYPATAVPGCRKCELSSRSQGVN